MTLTILFYRMKKNKAKRMARFRFTCASVLTAKRQKLALLLKSQNFKRTSYGGEFNETKGKKITRKRLYKRPSIKV